MWSCLDGSTPLGELATELGDAFQVDAAVIEADIVALARQLGEEGLLEGVGPGTEDHTDAPHDHSAHGGEQSTEGDPPWFLAEPPSP